LRNQIRFDFIGNEEQRCFTVSRQARLDWLAVVLDPQLQAEVVSPDRRRHIRLNAVQAPEGANVLE
jgi:hypothetical protein